MDVVRKIQAFNAGREQERLQIKYSKMRASVSAFLRGSCHLFYLRLPRGGIFKSAPLAWICGDLHIENFGSYKGDNRLVYFDLNDFEEAVLAPASWDLIRLLTSVWVVADNLSIGRSEARGLCKLVLNAYCASLALGKAYSVERETAQGLVRALFDELRDRQRAQFLDTRTQMKGKRRVLRLDGKKGLCASEKQYTAITDFMAKFASTQSDPDFYKVLDVGRRIAGTGSLGVQRYVILVQGKGSPEGNYLLDLKQSQASSVAPRLMVAQPSWKTQAHRIVELQRRLQAVSVAFLQPITFGKSAGVLRELQPSEDRITLDRSSQSMGELRQLIETMGRIVAWAHLRGTGRSGSAIADELIDYGQREKWKAKLLSASEHCAEQVRKDAATFNCAYDDGEFDP